MQKIIWMCWFQGRQQAPELICKCLQSWEQRNPGWDIRFLDAGTISRYIDLSQHIDLTRQTITAASLSKILRVLLLHEYGGVWVDATTFCNAPLDDWLHPVSGTGFFAFSRRREDCLLASWFLAAEPGNSLLANWAARVLRYCQGPEPAYEPSWFHDQFRDLCATDKQAFRAWQDVPRVSADGPHSILSVGMYDDFNTARSKIDWTVPVFKLTHRLDAKRLTPNCLVARLLGMSADDPITPAPARLEPQTARPIGLLKVTTTNLGDHIQIIAAEEMLRRAGLKPSFFVDRDDEVAHPPPVKSESAPGIVLNGWFKHNLAEWPPHSAYSPLYLGFHIHSFESRGMTSRVALEHYTTHGPIGARDRYTHALLRSHGVDAFLSNCLTVTFARRLPDLDRHTEVFVSSYSRRILDYLPPSIGPYKFVSHLTDSDDFEENMQRAAELLSTYRNRAKLVITTLLHCALPAIAMGIPVVVFYPPEGAGHRRSHIERFSSLCELVRIFWPSEAALVDWRGYTPNVGNIKLKLIDNFFAMATRWGTLASKPIGPIAPSSVLPAPSDYDLRDYGPEPVELAEEKSFKRQGWGTAGDYDLDGGARGNLSYQFVARGSRVLEIGTVSGILRRFITERCHYALTDDLKWIAEEGLVLDLDNDPIPGESWDIVVLAGALEHLYQPMHALRKVSTAASKLVFSYCCPVDGRADNLGERRKYGWVNAMTEQNINDEMSALGFHLSGKELLSSTAHFEQIAFEFAK